MLGVDPWSVLYHPTTQLRKNYSLHDAVLQGRHGEELLCKDLIFGDKRGVIERGVKRSVSDMLGATPAIDEGKPTAAALVKGKAKALATPSPLPDDAADFLAAAVQIAQGTSDSKATATAAKDLRKDLRAVGCGGSNEECDGLIICSCCRIQLFLERQCRLHWARATAKLVQKHCFFNRITEDLVTCFTGLMASIEAREAYVLNTEFSKEEIVDWSVPSEEETCHPGTTCDDVDSNVDDASDWRHDRATAMLRSAISRSEAISCDEPGEME